MRQAPTKDNILDTPNMDRDGSSGGGGGKRGYLLQKGGIHGKKSGEGDCSSVSVLGLTGMVPDGIYDSNAAREGTKRTGKAQR